MALAVVAAVGAYWLDRRRIEASLLSAKGVGPAALATKAILEVMLPVAVASVAGWYAATWLVKLLGPGTLLSPGAAGSAGWVVAWTAVAGLVLLGAVVAMVARSLEGGGRSAAGAVAARTPWELVIIVLTAASLYEILTRGGAAVQTEGGAAKVDLLLIMFPVLFIAGAASLVGRGLRRLLPWLRSVGSAARPGLFLATRRLAGASGIALGLVAAVALAVGILAYAGTLSASTKASSAAKAEVFVGGDVRATLLSEARLPGALSGRTTIVRQVDTAVAVPGQVGVTVLGVDPSTFAGGAFWDDSLAESSLADLLRRLAAQGDRAPVLVAGGTIPPVGALQFTRAGTHLAYRTAGAPRAFPLQVQGDIVVVVDARRLTPAKAAATTYLLGKGDPNEILASLSAAHVPFASDVSAREVQAAPAIVALSWLYGYLLALGLLSGLIVLAALVLYLAARQRGRLVSYALARRMGLTAAQHRRSLLLEIAGMLVTGFVVGTLFAWLGARLVAAKLDPLPALPPPELVRVPWLLYAGTGVVLVMAAWLGARFVQRSAERADVAEVMRVAV